MGTESGPPKSVQAYKEASSHFFSLKKPKKFIAKHPKSFLYVHDLFLYCLA